MAKSPRSRRHRRVRETTETGYASRRHNVVGVEIADALVGAAAVGSGLRLWTLNRKHYPMPELEFYPPP